MLDAERTKEVREVEGGFILGEEVVGDLVCRGRFEIVPRPW